MTERILASLDRCGEEQMDEFAEEGAIFYASTAGG
jgi:hypothetical protein